MPREAVTREDVKHSFRHGGAKDGRDTLTSCIEGILFGAEKGHTWRQP